MAKFENGYVYRYAILRVCNYSTKLYDTKVASHPSCLCGKGSLFAKHATNGMCGDMYVSYIVCETDVLVIVRPSPT